MFTKAFCNFFFFIEIECKIITCAVTACLCSIITITLENKDNKDITVVILMVIRFSVMYLIKTMNSCLAKNSVLSCNAYPGLYSIMKQSDF